MTTGAPPPAHVILACARDGLRARTEMLLRALGCQVTALTDVHDLKPALEATHADLVVLEVLHGTAGASGLHEVVSGLLAHKDDAPPRLLVLTPARSPEELKALFSEGELANFVIVQDDETVDSVELLVTVSKLVHGNVFGLNRYLQQGAHERAFKMQSSAQKEEVVHLAESCALEAGCNPRVARNLAAVVDELSTNALYNAPVDADGRHLFAHYDRRSEIVLEPGREVLVRFAWDAHAFGLSAEDRYGSLRWQKVLGYMKKCFDGGERQIDQKQGGAGLGLYMSFNMVNQFVLNLAPGIRSEAMGLVSISSSYKLVSSRGRSFNLFVDKG